MEPSDDHRSTVMSARSLVALVVGATVIALFLAGCRSTSSDTSSGTPLAEPMVGALDAVLSEAEVEFSLPGVIAGVWSPDGEWIGAVGTAGADRDDPITPTTHTRIGSVTKTFTVAALLRLVEQELMSLSDPIEKYVPGLPNGSTATLRDLAQMTSGIPSYTQNMPWLFAHYKDVDRAFTAEELLSYIRDEPALFEAGTRFDYSNSNTVAIGLAIEKATGQSLDQVLREQVIEPLGLTGTSWPGLSSDLPEPYLSGQTNEGLPEGTIKDATRWNPSWANAAGELISTLDDLKVWGQALGTGEGLLDPATHELQVASFEENAAIEGNSPDATYGIGVGLIDGWIGHTGELAGYNTSVLYDPNTHTTVVVVVNSNIPNAEGENPAPTISERLRAVLVS